MSERIKYTQYNGIWVNRFCWRTKQQQEIDYIQERNGKLYASELKWNSNKNVKPSLTFTNAYKESEFEVITPTNYLNFIS